MTLKIVASGMPRPVAEEMIHRLAKAGQISWEEPAFQRKMRQRDFPMRLVLETLTGGTVNQGPEKDEYGDWKCRIKRRVAGRLVRVVVAIHDERLLVLISVH